MKYMVVNVTVKGFGIVGEFEGDGAYARAQAASGGATLQVWEVDDFEATRKKVRAHNDIVSKTVDVDPGPQASPQVVKAGTKATIAPADLWDWSKVSAAKKSELLSLYKAEDWRPIMDIHNDLQLTSETYCCSYYVALIKSNIEKALSDGIL